jgi:hypothetical protein
MATGRQQGVINPAWAVLWTAGEFINKTQLMH